MREDNGGEDLAPVIPLFGAARPDPPEWHTTWTEPEDHTPPPEAEADAAARAERVLLKKLRTRSLSEREARAVLRTHELSDDTTEHLIDDFRRQGYLDDARLAEQLIHAGTSRKGQGRRAIAQALAGRGIPRDVVDGALQELPDDDAERALEFARTKARMMAGLDHDVALRRLAGQLARRGYGAAALSAARQALAELPRHGVRFDER